MNTDRFFFFLKKKQN